MAQFELNIYGKDDEILKTHATDRVRWGVLLQALEIADGLEKLSVSEQFKEVSEFIKKIFPELTDDELANADMDDVFNTFVQLTNKASKIGVNSKNANRAVTE